MKLDTYHYVAIGVIAFLGLGGIFLMLRCKGCPEKKVEVMSTNIKGMAQRLTQIRTGFEVLIKGEHVNRVPKELIEAFDSFNFACDALEKAIEKA